MFVRDALQQGGKLLREAGVADAGFEAEYLIRHILGCSRESLLIHLDSEISSLDKHHYYKVTERRAAGEPAAYITGRKEFYGLEFKVDSRALIPRPETELLVEMALDFASCRAVGVEFLRIAEVGVGCGAISVALAAHLPNARIVATDISPEALDLARENATRHRVESRVTLLEGDLLKPVSGSVDILVSNPPYIKSDDIVGLAREIRYHEPHVALDGGPDGMAVINRVIEQAEGKLAPGGAMFVEIGWNLGDLALHRARELFPKFHASITPDLAGFDRVLTIRPPVGVAVPA